MVTSACSGKSYDSSQVLLFFLRIISQYVKLKTLFKQKMAKWAHEVEECQHKQLLQVFYNESMHSGMAASEGATGVKFEEK